MALRAKWTVRVDDLQTELALGDTRNQRQPVLVSLLIEGLTPEEPDQQADCLDVERVCEWITDVWPQSAGTPLIENRVNELLQYLFARDKRVQSAWVGLYRTKSPQDTTRVGVERKATRSQFQARLRASGA
jgi:dihydroneopterin aldolase